MKNLNEKITIIIPIFNAEKYIKKCVLSILNQSYKNFELILINDGSIDNSINIINDFNDKRIVLINKENEGVSATRNYGINIATGDYIVFVDADDYLSNDYLEYMLSLVHKTNANFCISKNCFTSKNEEQVELDKIEKIASEDAIALLLSPRVVVGCWNKIYKTKFLKENNIKFSTKLFYGEGLSFIINSAQLSNYVGVGNKKVYYYRRNNELSATSKFDIEKMRNGEKSLMSLRDDIKLKSNKIDTMWRLHISLFSLGAIVRLKSLKISKEYKEDYKHWKFIINDNLKYLIFNRDISLYRKCLLISGRFFPLFISKLDQVRRKKISKNSV